MRKDVVLGRLWDPLSWRPYCEGETCLRDEDKGDFCLVLRELDQKFYYWSWEELVGS